MKIVIMAGGKGTRFWPWSTTEKPKQFMSFLGGNETLLQQTYKRFCRWLPIENIYIITTEEYADLVREQIKIPEQQLLIEPARRDTGPCAALCARTFLRQQSDEVFASVPADHFISRSEGLKDAFKLAEKEAEKDKVIVTLGIKPTRPETGYGYIQCEEKDGEYLKAKRFIEKPSADHAQQLYKMNNVYWNSGIFVWKPSTVAYFMKKFQPQLYQLFKAEDEQIEKIYRSLPNISVDYAILEKADSIHTIPVHFDWDDVGKWSALERFYPVSESGNIIIGDAATSEVENCIIKVDQTKAVIAGVKDLIIASTAEGLLICHKSKEKELKNLLSNEKIGQRRDDE